MEIHLVDAPIHQPITQHAEHEQEVQGGKQERVVEHKIESADGSVYKLATRYEQAADGIPASFSNKLPSRCMSQR